MKRLVLVGALAGALAATTAFAQTSANLGTVHIPKKVMANGQALAAGTYQVRATEESAPPAAGQDPKSEQWVEFLKGGKVVGKEVATVVPAAEISKIAKGKRPKANSSMVEMLKGGDYWRVWINKGGTNYIINLPPAA